MSKDKWLDLLWHPGDKVWEVRRDDSTPSCGENRREWTVLGYLTPRDLQDAATQALATQKVH